MSKKLTMGASVIISSGSKLSVHMKYGYVATALLQETSMRLLKISSPGTLALHMSEICKSSTIQLKIEVSA